jgi:hypothetical protein
VRRWSLTPDFIVPAGQAAMDMTWFYGLVALIQSASPGPLHFDFVSLFGPVAIVGWLAKGTAILPWSFPWRRLLLLALCILTLIGWLHVMLDADIWSGARWLAIATEPWRFDPGMHGDTIFVACFVAFLLWGRGLWIGVGEATTAEVTRWLIGGIVVLIALCAIVGSTRLPDAETVSSDLRLLLVTYFVLGLALTAIVHAQAFTRSIGRRQRLSPSWAVAITVPMAIIAAIALFFSSGVAPTVQWFMRLGVALAVLIWTGILWLLYWIFLFLRWLASLFPAGSAGQVGRTRSPRIPRSPAIEPPHWHPSGPPMDVTVIVGIAILVILAAIMILLVFRQVRRGDTITIDEERSSVWSWQLFLDQLRRLLRRGGAGLEATAAEQISHDTSELPEIRLLYRRLLSWGAGHGHARHPSATPLEYAGRLAAVAPALSSALAAVTRGYVDCRYGDKQVDDDTIVVVRAAAEKFRETQETPRNSGDFS